MKNMQRRHDLSDEAWALLEPHLPGQSGQWGGIAKGNRLFINAVFGFCAQERHGATCLLNTGDGELCIRASSVGATSEYGKAFLKY